MRRSRRQGLIAACGALLALVAPAMLVMPVSADDAVASPDPVPGHGSPALPHSPEMLQMLSRGRPLAAAASANWAPGIDISSWQHPGGAGINWSQVAGAGYKFAYIKATEGNYYGNPYYSADNSAAKDASLYAGAYHYAIPSASSGSSQADYFMDSAAYARDGMTLAPVLDIEWNPYDTSRPCYGLSPAGMASWISDFGSEVQRLTGRLPVIYTAASWWTQCTGGSAEFGSYPLWIASWSSSAPAPAPGWSSWTMWQYTSSGRVPGIAGSVDLDYFDGNPGQLADG